MVTQIMNEQTADLLTEVFERIPSALVIVDRDGRIARANPAAVHLLGGPLVGERWWGIIQSQFCRRQDDGYEVSLRNGRRVQVSTSALQQTPGQLIQITDLTETRQLQAKLGHMERLSSLGRMAATLAHQIRTPLSAALLYAANLKNQKLNAMAREQFQDKLLSRLHELEHQVSDVLLFARAGAVQGATLVELDSLWTGVARRIESFLQQHAVHCDWPEPLPELCFLGNQEAWVNAIANLLENAVQAGATELKVSADVLNNQIQIGVADNGRGMPAEVQRQIFEPFFTTRSQGTGLGLAVVQAVVQAHQGTIRVESKPGQGSCFVLSLPVSDKERSL